MNKSDPYSFGKIILALLWAIVVTVGYYFVHKPIDFPQFIAFGQACATFSLALALIGLAGGVGTRLFSPHVLFPLERFAIQAALGAGVLGLLWLVVGLLGCYSSGVAWGALILGWLFFWRDILLWLHEIAAVKQIWHSSGRVGKIFAAGAGLLAGGQLLFALLPPVKWDALMYHLDLPRRYLAAGRFYFVSSNPYWGHPQLTEMLHTWAVSIAGLQLATTLMWCIAITFLLGVLGTVARRLDATSAWLALVALVVGFSFRGLMGSGYVDVFAALYGYAVLVMLLAWQEQRIEKWLWWAGIFAGIALWVKLTAVLLLPLMGVSFIVFDGWSTHSYRRILKITLLALLVFSPWLLISFLYTGNPIYPHLWPTAWTSPERLFYFNDAGLNAGSQAFWLPLAITWFGVDTANIEGMVAYASDIGPLLLLFAVPGLLFGWRSPPIRVVGVWILGGWVAMAVAGYYSPLLYQTRLYFILLPAVAMAAGWGWYTLAGVTAYGVRLRRVLAALVFLVLSFSLWQDAQTITRSNPMAVIFGQHSPDEYMDKTLGDYASAMRFLQDMPGGSRTLLLWEPRGLYAPNSAEPDVWIDRWYLDRQSLGDPQAIFESWQSLGFTHLLLSCAGANFERENRAALTSADWQALDDLLVTFQAPVEFGETYALYSLQP